VTEAQWPAATHIYELTHCSKCRDDRKRRLPSAVCARRVLHHLTDPRFQEVVEGCERFADGLIVWKDMLAIRKTARAARRALDAGRALPAQLDAARVVEVPAQKEFQSYKPAMEAAQHAVGQLSRPDFTKGCELEAAYQIQPARDIFGNPRAYNYCQRLVVVCVRLLPFPLIGGDRGGNGRSRRTPRLLCGSPEGRFLERPDNRPKRARPSLDWSSGQGRRNKGRWCGRSSRA
jgi:hypothetical protein